MTGRGLHTQWCGLDRDDFWDRLPPAEQRAWDRLAAWMTERERAAVAEVIMRREGS